MPTEAKLNPVLQKKICSFIEKGNYFGTSCELAGICEKTGYNWLNRGRNKEEPFLQFLQAVKKAEAKAEAKAAEEILAAARGRIAEKVEEGTGPKGEFSKVTREMKREWTAAAWYLERKFPTKWGRAQMDVLQALQVLADNGWIPAEVVEVASNEIGRVREVVQQAFREEQIAIPSADIPGDPTV